MLHHWKKHAFSAARMLAPLHRYINTHRVLIQHPDTSACSKNSSETDSSTPLYQQCFEIGLHFQTICCIAIVFNNTTIQLYTYFGKNRRDFRARKLRESHGPMVKRMTVLWINFDTLHHLVRQVVGTPGVQALCVFPMSSKVIVSKVWPLPAAILCRMHPIPSELGS